MSDARWGQRPAGAPRAGDEFAWVVDLASRRVIRMRVDPVQASEAGPSKTCHEQRASGSGRGPKYPIRSEEI